MVNIEQVLCISYRHLTDLVKLAAVPPSVRSPFLIQIANAKLPIRNQIEKRDRNVVINDNCCEFFVSDRAILRGEIWFCKKAATL